MPRTAKDLEDWNNAVVFGRMLKSHRTRMKKMCKQMSFEMGVSVKALYDWESGKSHPPLSRQIELAKYFGRSLSTLYADFERLRNADRVMRNQHIGEENT